MNRMRDQFGALGLKSRWLVECLRKGTVVWTENVLNLMTNEGLNSALDILFNASTQITAWYVGIFEDDYTPLATNTYAVPGFTESTAYDEATRPAWTGAAASSQVVTNSASKASFTMNATKTIYGGFLVGGGSAANTKADAAGGGTLMCAARFTTAKSVVSSDVLRVTVSITASDA